MRAFTVCVLAASLMLAACAPEEPEESGAGARRSVVVQLVQPQEVDVSIKLPVLIQPKETIELRAASSGKITSLGFEEGASVPGNAVPNAPWLDLTKEQQAKLDDLRTDRAKVGKDSDQYTVITEQILQLDEEITLRNLRHLTDLECFGRTDDSQLLQSFREAQANYDQAVRDLWRTEKYEQSTAAQLDLARTRRNSALANAKRVRAMIEDTYICNPVTGILTERIRRVGEYVNMGELIGKTAVMSTLIAELEVPEAHLQTIAVGQTLQLEIRSQKDETGKPVSREAKVTRIDSVAHPVTHSFTVELEVPNADLSLPAGVFGTTELSIYNRTDALVVPYTAVRLNGASKSLFVLPASGGDKVVELQDIELGQYSKTWAEIRGSKLKPGMRVVTFGAHLIGDGDQVTWTETDPYVIDAEPRS